MDYMLVAVGSNKPSIFFLNRQYSSEMTIFVLCLLMCTKKSICQSYHFTLVQLTSMANQYLQGFERAEWELKVGFSYTYTWERLENGSLSFACTYSSNWSSHRITKMWKYMKIHNLITLKRTQIRGGIHFFPWHSDLVFLRGGHTYPYHNQIKCYWSQTPI
jgi:hypothetical protein